MDDFANDIRFGLRTLRSNKATTLAALVALALGIGATTAIFSVVNAVLLKPLPYPEPDELMVVWESNPEIGFPRFAAAPSNFVDWQDQSKSFERLAAITAMNINMTGEGEAERVPAAAVSAELWDVAGLDFIQGRPFTRSEDRPGQPGVAVISQGFWKRRFGGDPGVVNRQLTLNGMPFTVVGVAPEGFDLPPKRDMWVPAAIDRSVEDRGGHSYLVFGRLKDGVTREQAEAELKGIARRLEMAHPDSNKGWSATILPLKEVVVEKVRVKLLALLAGAAVVLLIACLNVANLLLARLAAREREIALRTAIGAGRMRLVRQLLTESLVLSLVGGAIGVVLAYWGTKLLVAMNADNIPRASGIGLDAQVLVFTLGISVLSGLFFGLFPALHNWGPNLFDTLKEGGRAVAGGARGRFARQALVLGEVAIALVLLVAAGLLIRSFSRLTSIDPGFRPEGVLALDVALPQQKYADPAKNVAFYRELLERVRTVAGVEKAATVAPLPLVTAGLVIAYQVEGRPIPNPSLAPSANVRSVSPDFFQTLGVTLTKGRAFTEQEDGKAPHVVIVNETMAKQVWPGEDAIGKRLTFDVPVTADSRWATVVGIAKEVKHRTLSEDSGQEAYWPMYQRPLPFPATLVVRTHGDPAALTGPIRAEIAAIDRDLPAYQVRTMEEVVAGSLVQDKFLTVLFSLFAGLALVLASVGVYGVVSYSVTQRTHEIGIRMALGAHRRDVLGMVIRQGMGIALVGVAVGLVIGLVMAVFFGKLLAGMLYGVSTTDPLTFIAVPLALALVALLANYLPARKATRVDPLVALRQE